VSTRADRLGAGGNLNDVELWLICSLRPSEGVCASAVVELTDRIRHIGVWTHPIAVCEQTGLIMDGNHRLKAAQRLGLQRVPVVPLSYLGGRVVVRDRTDGGLFDLSRLRPIVDTGTLLPYKTTAHEFEPALPVVSIGLNRLIHGPTASLHRRMSWATLSAMSKP
jgi:hypothetical protein